MSTALAPEPLVYTADEVAKILRCNRETVYRWVKKGRLKSCDRDGTRAHRFTLQHIEDFLNPASAVAEPLAPKPTRHPKYATARTK
jgi:excisionase family DNA binding protein